MVIAISSVFHLHNTSATCELSVYLDGQRLQHECHPTYLGVTLDRTLSYRVHLTKTAGKLKHRNNSLMKLAGSTWGTSVNTLQSSALALCYSAAEYCAPVWLRSAHTTQVGVQLNSTMRLISGTLRSTPLPSFQCSPTLNRQPYEGRLPLTSWWRKSSNMTVGQSRLISLTHHCYDWHPGSRCGWTCNQLRSKVDDWRHNWKSARVVSSHLVCDPTIRQPGFDLPQQQWSLLNRFPQNRDTAVPAEENGDLQTLIYVLVAIPTMSHIVKSCPLTKLNGGLSRLHSADEDVVSWVTSYG